MGMVAYDRIAVDGIIRFASLESFTMMQAANEHATAFLRGTLTEEGVQAVCGPLGRIAVTVADTETSNIPIFQGYVRHIRLISENGLDTAEVELEAGSSILDKKTKKKSYQDIRLTYDEVIKDVLSDFEGADFLNAPEMRGRVIGTPVIRYDETAWAFIGRLGQVPPRGGAG